MSKKSQNQPQKATKTAKIDPKDQQINELTGDLQRLGADFENYRKRMEAEKIASHEYGAREMVQKLLPVLDNIERALKNVPAELKEQAWVQGVENLGKNLDKTLAEIGLTPIEATPGVVFDHELHNAVQMDEGEGETEVVAQELQKGYKLNGQVLREATVRVTRK